MPIAVAFGAVGLIEGGNVDFFVLRRDPLVVAVLVALVALTAPAMALADGWLDRRLPHAASGRSTAGGLYVALTVIGGALGAMLMFQALFDPKSRPLGFTVVVVGLMTLAWWYRQRTRGRTTPPLGLDRGTRRARARHGRGLHGRDPRGPGARSGWPEPGARSR